MGNSKKLKKFKSALFTKKLNIAHEMYEKNQWLLWKVSSAHRIQFWNG